MTNILLIGAGQIGSRHLQSLALLDIPLRIDVVDLSETSRNVAQARFEEIKNSNQQASLHYFESIALVENNTYDVALITTDSKPRRAILEELLPKVKIKYLVLEKFLFPRVEDYAVIGDLIDKHGIKAYVNTARRLYKHYQDISNFFVNEAHIHFRVSGSDWGLGCNGIHFVDLFAMLSGSENLQLSTQQVDNTILDSKRRGYIEFTGTLTGVDDRNNSIEITSYYGGTTPVQVEISSKSHRVVVNEKTCEMLISSESTGWATQMSSFKPQFQSELTHIVVKDLIEKGTCQLPTYTESAHLHLVFLNAFLEFINRHSEEKTNICPIT